MYAQDTHVGTDRFYGCIAYLVNQQTIVRWMSSSPDKLLVNDRKYPIGGKAEKQCIGYHLYVHEIPVYGCNKVSCWKIIYNWLRFKCPSHRVLVNTLITWGIDKVVSQHIYEHIFTSSTLFTGRYLRSTTRVHPLMEFDYKIVTFLCPFVRHTPILVAFFLFGVGSLIQAYTLLSIYPIGCFNIYFFFLVI